MNARTVRVLLVDDHPVVRAGLRALLEGFGGITVTAEAGDGQEALRALVDDERPTGLAHPLHLVAVSGQ